MSRLDRVGMVARWRPVHRGHAVVLEALCASSREVVIGIGSANRYNDRNPFTAAEAAAMIHLVLGDREGYTLIEVPDLDDGPRWRELVVRLFGPLDAFVTANPYVAHLMGESYRVEHPVELIPVADRVAVEGAMVRRAMAEGGPWWDMVPDAVADLIRNNGLDERFRREFGLATLARALES
jgi:nicotinamide-nucleotide adenylyltransferase